MGIVKVDMYAAVCDGCDLNITAESGDYIAWGDRDQARDDVENGDGYAGSDDLIACQRCLSEYRSTLPDEEWDALANREPKAETVFEAWLLAKVEAS